MSLFMNAFTVSEKVSKSGVVDESRPWQKEVLFHSKRQQVLRDGSSNAVLDDNLPRPGSGSTAFEWLQAE
jgi:hypothetical protein